MKTFFVFFLLLLTSCTKKVKIDQNGDVSTMEISVFTKSKDLVEKQSVNPQHYTRTVSCTYSGFCFACGINLYGESGCGAGLRSDCRGQRQEEYQVLTELYRTEYQLKDKVVRTPLTQRSQSVVLNTTSCR